MEEFIFRCECCGVLFEVFFEMIIVVCFYCGYLNYISGNIKIENIYIVFFFDKNVIV